MLKLKNVYVVFVHVYFPISTISRQTQTIDPSLLPQIPCSVRISRQVDYSFVFSIRERNIKKKYSDFVQAQPDVPMGHTADPFGRHLVYFSGVEVKQAGGDATEALVQLSIWLSAQLEKLLQLSKRQGKSLEESQLPPVVGWTVVGHQWNLYMAFRGVFDGKDTIVRKPFPVARLQLLTSVTSSTLMGPWILYPLTLRRTMAFSSWSTSSVESRFMPNKLIGRWSVTSSSILLSQQRPDQTRLCDHL